MPEPLADLDHVPATAETVLERVRYLHERYELEHCRVAAARRSRRDVAGVRRPRRAAAGAGGRRRRPAPAHVPGSHGVDTWFADLRVGLPAPLRERFDVVLTDPPYSPAGVGLFAARALEAMKRESRLLVAYGVPGGLAGARAEGPGRAERAGARLRGGAAGLQRLRRRAGDRLARARSTCCARPSAAARSRARRGERHAEAMYTRGRQAVESERRAARSVRAGGRARRAVLRRGLEAAAGRAARRADGRRRPSSSTSRRTSSTASTRRRSRRSRSAS